MFLLARITCYLINWLITVFAWDEIAHADIGWEGDALMLQEVFCPDALGDIHEAPLWTSQCGSVQAGAQRHTALAGLFNVGFVPSSVPELELLLSQGAWFSHMSQLLLRWWPPALGTEQQVYLPAQPSWVSGTGGATVKGGFLTTGLESSYNFNNQFLWARPSCPWHLTETCLGRITQCPVDSVLPSGVFGCEHQPCCSARAGAWLMSYPSAAAGKPLLINSFSKDNHLPL